MLAQQQIPEIISVVAAVTVLVLSWRWKDECRFSLTLIFVLAGLASIYRAFLDPEEYISTIQLTSGSWGLRMFFAHATAIVTLIGVVQLAIAFLISLRGWAVHTGLVVSILFLLGIVPLGAERGFSSRLLFSLAALLLLRHAYTATLSTKIAALLRHQRHASGAY